VKCEGVMLMECSMTGEYTMKEMCPSAELCSETNKSCDPMKCAPDTFSCENGSLLKCKEDLTGFEVETPCEAELCDDKAGKCNMCIPDSKTCEGESTLVTCSADGAGDMMTPCTGMTKKCAMESGKCVQCTSNDDCMPMNECMTSTCDMGTGMCAAETPKTRGTVCSGGMCDLLGSCAECLEDSECSSSERCVAGLGCVPRAALEVTPSLLRNGAFTVNVSPGYAVEIEPANVTVRVGGTLAGGCGSISSTCKSSKNNTNNIQSLTITGPAEGYCGIRSLLAGETVRLSFEATMPLPDEPLALARCDDGTVTLSARTD
jgi:rRNA maturation protein Nop10